MAERAVTVTHIRDDMVQLTWEGLTENDTCAPYAFTRMPVAGAVYANDGAGAWGGATLNIKGSVDGTLYANMVDGAGSDVALSADGGSEIAHPNYLFVQPVANSGTSQDLDTITALFRF